MFSLYTGYFFFSYACFCSKVNFTLSSSWYIGSVTWATESVLSVAWLPRSQTSIYYSLCPPPLYHCKTVSGIMYKTCKKIIKCMAYKWSAKSSESVWFQIAADVSFHRPNRGWVQNHGTPIFSEDASKMAVILSTDQGEHGYFPHLVVFR